MYVCLNMSCFVCVFGVAFGWSLLLFFGSGVRMLRILYLFYHVFHFFNLNILPFNLQFLFLFHYYEKKIVLT